jgi:CRP-like cAMP-binding protein
VAAELELRSAKVGTELLTAGEPADALYITLAGPVEIRSPARAEPEALGAGVMFGHATLLEHVPSGIGVRVLNALLTMRFLAKRSRESRCRTP